MTKPFELSALAEKLKSQGLPIAEELCEKIAEAVLEWTEESLVIHPNPYVKFAIPVLGAVKPLLKNQIDKIDGKEG